MIKKIFNFLLKATAILLVVFVIYFIWEIKMPTPTIDEKFSLENVTPLYEKFFNDIMNLKESNGWYETDIPKVLETVEADELDASSWVGPV